MDSLATQHFNSFWALYGLQIKIPVEHKQGGTAIKAALINKADYCQLCWDPEFKSWTRYHFVVRGVTQFKGEEDHPKIVILYNIMGIDKVLVLEYEIHKIMKIPTFRKIQNQKTKKKRPELLNVKPGESYTVPLALKINNLAAPCMTVKDFKRRRERPRRTPKLFEKFRGSLPLMFKRMLEDNLSNVTQQELQNLLLDQKKQLSEKERKKLENFIQTGLSGEKLQLEIEVYPVLETLDHYDSGEDDEQLEDENSRDSGEDLSP